MDSVLSSELPGTETNSKALQGTGGGHQVGGQICSNKLPPPGLRHKRAQLSLKCPYLGFSENRHSYETRRPTGGGGTGTGTGRGGLGAGLARLSVPFRRRSGHFDGQGFLANQSTTFITLRLVQG